LSSQDNLFARLERAISIRFGEDLPVDPQTPAVAELVHIAEHRSDRRYASKPVDPGMLRLLLACAFSAPSKSDLQQADVVDVRDADVRKAIADLVPDMPWIGSAPVFLVFCGNSRRARLLSELRGKPFANDHLDTFINAAVDASIVMTTFMRAAGAVGLGCCPISAVRRQPGLLSRILALPDWVFPLAGLCVGYPTEGERITPRLPLQVTVHTDRYSEAAMQSLVDGYDRRRHALQPYAAQRGVDQFGKAEFYGWSEDKARQNALPEQADFGAFIRSKRFSLS